MVEMNVTFFNRAHHKINRMAFKAFGQQGTVRQLIDLLLFISPGVRAGNHIHTTIVGFGVV